mgnify:CR=1 FL=1
MASFRYLFSLSLLIALPIQGSTPTFVEAVCMPHKVLLELFRRKLKPQPREIHAEEGDTFPELQEKKAGGCLFDVGPVQQASQIIANDMAYEAARAAAIRALRQAQMA